MRPVFVQHVLASLIRSADLHCTDRILAVCSDAAERSVFQALGCTAVTISNLDPTLRAEDCAPYAVSCEDAMALSFADGSFDFAFVSDGLHHCDSPHRALLEMYRVARKGVIVVESRDSLLVRAAVALGLSQQFEVSAVTWNQGRSGGVNNSEIPNYIYRWTEREFEKTLRAHDPTGRHRFRYFYAFSAPPLNLRSPLLRRLAQAAVAVLAALVRWVAPGQSNSFAMIAMRPQLPRDLWPWLRMRDGRPEFRR